MSLTKMVESYQLRPEGKNLLVTVAVRRLDSSGIDLFERTWRKDLHRLSEQDADWPWREELVEYAGDRNRELYQLVDDQGRLHALSSLCLRLPSRLKRQLTVVYVERLAVAPWNRVAYKPNRGLVGCGTAMLHHAIKRSSELPSRGRIGLHSLNDPNTENFYRKSGLQDLGLDPQEENLRYFEMTEEGACAFLARRL